MGTVDHRTFFRRGAGLAGSAMIPVSMSGLPAACTEQDPTGTLVPRSSSLVNAGRGGGGYGPLVNNTGVLLLPEDFQAATFGVVGTLMHDGNVTPLAHDGMAAFRWKKDRVRLIRNQEDRNNGGRLVLIFESPGVDVLDSPDNITVSPRGGLVLCEDGGGTQFLRGLTRHGDIFTLAQNVLNGQEFAGACFSPEGDVLFCNIQGATSGQAVATGANPAPRGLTMAITGPWRRGSL